MPHFCNFQPPPRASQRFVSQRRGPGTEPVSLAVVAAVAARRAFGLPLSTRQHPAQLVLLASCFLRRMSTKILTSLGNSLTPRLPVLPASSSSLSSSLVRRSPSPRGAAALSRPRSPAQATTRSFSSTPMAPRDPSYRVLTNATINKNVLEAQYAVRGAIPLRAEELRDQLDAGDKSLPFDTVVSCNIGNPQQLDQKPLTFLRQVSHLLFCVLCSPRGTSSGCSLTGRDRLEGSAACASCTCCTKADGSIALTLRGTCRWRR